MSDSKKWSFGKKSNFTITDTDELKIVHQKYTNKNNETDKTYDHEYIIVQVPREEFIKSIWRSATVLIDIKFSVQEFQKLIDEVNKIDNIQDLIA